MWVDEYRNQITGKRNIVLGEKVADIPPHKITRYTGKPPIGTDSSAFEITNEDCIGREARVCRVFTTAMPRIAGGLSYTGIGLAACTHDGCPFVVPVTIEGRDRLVIMPGSTNRS